MSKRSRDIVLRKKLTTSRFDIHGNTILRLIRFYATSRIIPMGDNRGGPGWRCLAILFICHYFGRLVFQLKKLLNGNFIFLSKIIRKIRL